MELFHLWEVAKREGRWMRFLNWCGALQAAVGFSMPILLLEAIAIAAAGYPKAAHAVMSLWYLAIIFPLLGSGIAITLQSLLEAWKSRRPANMAVAGWNTLATASNIYDAARTVGPELGFLKDFFSSSDSDEDDSGLAVYLVLLAVAVALGGGILITGLLIRHYARQAHVTARQLA